MEHWTADSRLPLAVDALSLSESDPAARRLMEAFDGDPVAVEERLVGEPATVSRRLRFSSQTDVILHDDAIVAVSFRTAPAHGTSGLRDGSDWVGSLDEQTTLDDLAVGLGERPRFAGTAPYFELGGGYARADFRDGRGWNDPGNFLGVTITIDQPGLACRPEDDDCPVCSDLLVRPAGQATGVDVRGTVEALSTGLAAGVLSEDVHRVRLADVQPLFASRLMRRVETQLTCSACRRIICFTLHRDSSPTVEYTVLNDATRRPVEPIPPVELWGDADRIAADRAGMHYVDHEPESWFLVEQEGVLYLEARYSYSAIVDSSALIRLDDAERERYRTDGHNALSDLATQIHNSAPYREESAYFQRNLYRGSDAKQYRDAVARAISNRTWLAERSRG
ncbi:MAG TPA: hypothetical protein VNJ54_20950 [Plantibacter sp.]|uniref:hypothetical protein n=1 Tax=unclassified Plantibacter TaxID=2624265 RepID=UPI002CBC1A13|nr:hypothetical protein [Plantibacter sp.]